MVHSRTVCRGITLSGIGLHSGQRVELRIKPSRRGKIFFRRLDLGGLAVEVDPQKTEVRNCTTLGSGYGAVQTVEHLMAALLVFGLDSLEIELTGSEVPAMDGSAGPIAQAILEAGTMPLPEKRKSVRILRAGTVRDGPASLSYFPGPDFQVSYSIDFSHPLILKQEISLCLTRKTFLEEIAPARTFGFLKDVPGLFERGLARGGTLENAVVLDDEKSVSGPLRYPDEFVRHKVLDLLGDLALFGHPLLGHFRADRAGHTVHLRAVRFLLENPDHWAFDESAAPSYLQE
ncbi:MAG: UDP-3-O-acyl-N-acetylglucosamine deacetylase [Acidobacteriota bacterium]